MLLPSSLPLVSKAGLLLSTILYGSKGILLAIYSTYFFNLTPVIPTENGAVQGKIAYSRSGQEYWQFLGIPYAQPPVNSLRFQPPVPAKSWESVKKVTRFPAACAQFDPLFVVRYMGQEDCLFLNVFTHPSLENAPVLVYIHGGAFLEGETAVYRPTFFMDYPIVVVTVQYRLGPLGFLNFEETEDPKYPRGNMGLKDQNMALKWVQRNIAAFGGNPAKVTIMGDSAGAASVNYHMISPLSRNLFQRAVAMSGSSLCPWAYTGRPRDIAEKYAGRLGCSYKNATELFECFQKMDAQDLLKMQWSWADPSLEKDEFVPSVERVLVADDTFLAERPIEIMKRGECTKVPFMTGIVSGEGSLRAARLEAIPEVMDRLASNWTELVGRLLFFDQDPVSPEMSKRLKQFYFGNKLEVRSDKRKVLKRYTDLTGDALFNEPVHTAAKQHANTGAPTYLLYYEYRSRLFPGGHSFYRAVSPMDEQWSVSKLLWGLASDWFREKLLNWEQDQRAVYGVGHAENALQVWDALGLTRYLLARDEEFSREFVKTLVNFVRGR